MDQSARQTMTAGASTTAENRSALCVMMQFRHGACIYLTNEAWPPAGRAQAARQWAVATVVFFLRPSVSEIKLSADANRHTHTHAHCSNTNAHVQMRCPKQCLHFRSCGQVCLSNSCVSHLSPLGHFVGTAWTRSWAPFQDCHQYFGRPKRACVIHIA